ncbi:C-Myc-binding protein homolog isoform X2 [Amborella trichopoda]|uniref:C-Myc-binding protein homolog isoform X2 n=1 Tax=Amborella trichopoda TaxID=13333 RepID=UPI0005D329E1|nr:C-Myc-binding protein homolog isoform X2 [Amborella trichopoda]|eukprot:XP_011621552.1 C-Myc-binding protein homolog isoform X2 [Amborella trichopoda]
MANEAKKEAFRKYLESSGVLDALTKVLVALYEENEKPSVAIEFIQRSLGGPSVSEYEKLQAEKADLQLKYDELLAIHQDKCKEIKIENIWDARPGTHGHIVLVALKMIDCVIKILLDKT